MKLLLILPLYYTIVKKTKKNKTFLVNMTWYRNAHFMILNKVKHHYHQLIKDQYDGSQFTNPFVHYKIYAKRKGTDGGNIRSIIEKFALDGLVEVGAIPDDTIDFISMDKAEYFYDKDNPRAEIYLTEEGL